MTFIRDNSSDWNADYYPAPANFDRAGYQRQIDRIVGTVGGHPIIRIVWGAEEETEAAAQFTGHGTATKMVRIGRHMTRVRGKVTKVRKRRWIFEEWQPPQQIVGEGFIQVPGAAGLYLPPTFAQEQTKGKWLELYVVADHSKCRREVCDSFEYFCFGDYREPDNSDLNKLATITALKAGVDNPNPFAPIGQNKINLYNKQATEEVEQKEAERQTELDTEYGDVKKTLAKVSTSGGGKLR
jgi:hypothetical protein